MNDFIALIMIIVVYFLPYFFIFTLIKLSAGSLGKLQAGLDKAGQVVKDSGRVKSFRDRAKESGAANRQRKATDRLNDANAVLNDESSTRFRRMRARASKTSARSTLGQLSASGKLGMRLQDESFDKAGQERTAELKSFMRDFNPDQQQRFLESLRDHNPADGALEFEGRRIPVDGGLKAAAIPTMLDFKINPESVYNEAQNTGGYYAAAVRRVMADNGATVDAKLTDISRSGHVIQDYVGDPDSSATIRSKQTANYADIDNDRKARVRDAIAQLSYGSGEDRAEAVGLLNMLARNSALTQADHAAISRQFGIDFGSVASSGGNLRFAEGASGEFEIRSSSATPTITPPPTGVGTP